MRRRKHIIRFWGGPWDGKHGDMEVLPPTIPYQDGTGYYSKSEDNTYLWVVLTESDIASEHDSRGEEAKDPPDAP